MTRANPKQVFFAGQWATVGEHARRFGKNGSTVYRRLARGYTLYDAIHEESQRGRPATVTAFGVSRSIVEWAAYYGVKADTIGSRLRHGWQPERAVSEPSQRQPLEAFGRAQSIVEWASETGLNPSTISSRINIYGMDPEVALTMPVQGAE